MAVNLREAEMAVEQVADGVPVAVAMPEFHNAGAGVEKGKVEVVMPVRDQDRVAVDKDAVAEKAAPVAVMGRGEEMVAPQGVAAWEW